jgi:anti-sigma28 factor (negative regulator of flagellin synthesis)
MALSNSDKNQIEVMIRKEIKSFLNANTVKQFENKIVDTIKDEIRRGKIQGDVTDIVTKVMREFYKIMWTQRSFWEPTLRRVK